MSNYPIYLRDVEDLNALPELVRDQIAKFEGLGYKREWLALDAQQKVHFFPELSYDEIFDRNDEGSDND